MTHRARIALICLLTLMLPVKPAAAEGAFPQTIVVTAGGDCTIGCLEEQKKSKNGFTAAVKKYGFDWFFSGLTELTAQDDMTLVNLEGPFTESRDKQTKTYNFKAPADYAEILTLGSVEAVNIANNHLYDYGKQGVQDTINALDERGIVYSGEGRLGIYQVKGVKIGMTGYCYPFKDGKANIALDVSALRQMGCQIVIASFHWGQEYDYTQNKEQKKIGRAAIDAGADLVIGHHPHVVQGIERYKGRYILYSLGNLVFGGNTDPKDRDAYLAQLRFTVDETSSRPPELQIIPVRLTEKKVNTDYRPVLATGKQKDKILRKILKNSKNMDDYPHTGAEE